MMPWGYRFSIGYMTRTELSESGPARNYVLWRALPGGTGAWAGKLRGTCRKAQELLAEKRKKGIITSEESFYHIIRRGSVMSEYSGRRDEKKAYEWADEIPAGQLDRDGQTDEMPDDHEEVYRDGSVRHECWRSDEV